MMTAGYPHNAEESCQGLKKNNGKRGVQQMEATILTH